MCAGAAELFAGRDVTRCLATMSLDESDLDDLTYMPEDGDLATCAALQRWERRLGGMCVGQH